MDENSDKKNYEIYKYYMKKDPFPEIKPALLNSADIHDYVLATKMIYPYNKDKLKPASYEVNFEGIVYYWDESGKKHKFDLVDRKSFVLKKNSIAFLFTHTKFQLPEYIAIRFNLKITHVHRGLLLGTGPLVDPGFEGKLLIPLHNLTTNDYVLEVGKGLIWVEFTKLSDCEQWVNDNDKIERKGVYKEFPENKKNEDAEYYFNKAAPGKDIRSSIPDVIEKTAKNAEKARQSAEKLEKRSFRLSLFGTIGIVLTAIIISITIYIGYVPISQLVQDSINFIKDQGVLYSIKHEQLNKKITKIENELNTQKYEQLNEKITKIEMNINSYIKLKKRIDLLEKEIADLKKK